jgi:hypothetical protein
MLEKFEIRRFAVQKPVARRPSSTAVISTAVVVKSRPVTVPSKNFQNPRRNGSATRRTGPVEPARRARRAALERSRIPVVARCRRWDKKRPLAGRERGWICSPTTSVQGPNEMEGSLVSGATGVYALVRRRVYLEPSKKRQPHFCRP